MKRRTLRIKAFSFIAAFLGGLLICGENTRAGEPYTGDPGRYYVWLEDYAVDDDTGMEKHSGVHFDFVTNGKRKVTTYDRRMMLSGIDAIWFGTPNVITCDACREKAEVADLYSVRIYLEDDDGNEIITRSGVRLGPEDLKTCGIDFETLTKPLRVAIEITQKPGEFCDSCCSHIGDNITVDGVYCHRTCLTVETPPRDTSADPGGVANFNIQLSRYVMTHSPDPRTYYKWAIREDNGEWRRLIDGPGLYGESYLGTNTPNLVVTNVTDQLNGKEYACVLNGTYGKNIMSTSARLTVNGTDTGGSADPGSGTDPAVDPAADPVTTPAPDPGGTADPAPASDPPVTGTVPAPAVLDPAAIDRPPHGGDYKPSTSSSAYVPPSGQPVQNPAARPTPSYSSSSSRADRSDDDSTYSRSTIETHLPGAGEKITASAPGNKGTASENGQALSGPGTAGTGTAGKGRTGSSSKGSTSKGSSSNGSSYASSTSVLKRPNSSTFMKNGILYVVDDDTPETGVGASSDGEKGDGADVTSVENENAYTASDLASEGPVQQQELTGGFFDTLPGYAVIILSSLILLLLALFFLFFGVIVFGEVEEHDEVFELCAVRIMLRREGNWYINLSSLFDDNAVVKLRIGILFARIFDGWELTGDTKGVYEGTVTGLICQNMEMHRKDIRRKV